MTEEEILALPYRPCVGLMLVNADGLIWAGRRLDNSNDAWQMPQGGVDKGETPEAAALRELNEETSIPSFAVEILSEMDDWIPYDLPHELVPKLWNGRFRGQEQKWFLMRFDGSDDMVDIETKDPEFSHWKWMGADELVEKIVPFKRDTYRQVFDAFGAYLET